MKRIHILGVILLSCLGIISCNTVKEEAMIILSTDRVEIATNGQECVTFTVKSGVTDITSSSTIYNAEGDIPLEGYQFSTSTPATYSFYAISGGDRSHNVATVNATDRSGLSFDVELISSADTIFADSPERADFTILCNGEDVSSSSELYLIESGKAYDTRILDMTFAAATPGQFRFYAIHNEVVSDTISVIAIEKPATITLSADNYKIVADGVATSTLSVKVNGADATAVAQFYIETEAEPQLLEGNTFCTTIAGTYYIYAVVEQGVSNTIEIIVMEAQAEE